MYKKLVGARSRRVFTVLVTTCVAGLGFASVAARAEADTQGPISFESYSVGTVDGQDGWSSLGAAGSGCATYDHAIADNSTLPNGAPASFGTKSLRISNAVTSGCFGDQTFSKKTNNEAGEPGADAGAFGSGTRQSLFSASFDLASVMPAAEQPGLLMSVSPDRGDGARMSYVRIEDSSSGWNLFFDDYVDVAPLGSSGNLDDGCSGLDLFRETEIADSLDRSVPHTIRFDMTFVPGPHNDVVSISIDGSLVHTGTSWEDYYRYCAESGGGTGGPLADQSRTVRSLLFRTGGDAVPANAGAGFLVDNVSVASSSPPPPPPPPPPSVPSAPKIGVATPGNGQATVHWTKPTSDGGAPINGYVVTPYIGFTPQGARVFNSTATTEVITGLTNAKPYAFKVVARNIAGRGPASLASNHVTAGAPLAPRSPGANPGNGQATVSWMAPASSNGAPVVGYVVTPYINGVAQPPVPYPSTALLHVVKNLQHGKTYRFAVAARNVRGLGPQSVLSNAVTVT